MPAKKSQPAKPNYHGSLADYKASVAKPKDNNDNRERQLRNNELAARAKSEMTYGVKSLNSRMTEAGYGNSGALARAFSKFGGGLLNRGK